MRAHGGKLLMAGMCVGQIFIVWWSCEHYLPQRFTPSTLLAPIGDRCVINNSAYLFSLYGQEIFYAVTALYLLNKARHPFYPASKLMRNHILLAIFITVILTACRVWVLRDTGDCSVCPHLFLYLAGLEKVEPAHTVHVVTYAGPWLPLLTLVLTVLARKYIHVAYTVLEPTTKLYIKALTFTLILYSVGETITGVVKEILEWSFHTGIFEERNTLQIVVAASSRPVSCVAWLFVYFCQRRILRKAAAEDPDLFANKKKKVGPAIRARLLDLISMVIRANVDETCPPRDDAFDAMQHLGVKEISVKSDNYEDKARAWALAPCVFQKLRALFNHDPENFKASFKDRSVERFTEGKSGAFLYFSCDNRFIIKTATSEEWKCLIGLLPDYYEHIVHNPNSLINRMVGAFELSLLNHRMRVIIVESCFPSGVSIHQRFDLKGSWVGRSTKQRKSQVPLWGREFDVQDVRKGVLKDLDMQTPLMLHPHVAKQMGKQLRSDIDFLGGAGIMDYSILLGITNGQCPVGDGDQQIANLSCVSVGAVTGPLMYSVGIIDVLQPFSCRKRLEFVFKRYFCCQGPGVSVQPPNQYANRMKENVVEALIERSPLKDEHDSMKEEYAGSATPSHSLVRFFEKRGDLGKPLLH